MKIVIDTIPLMSPLTGIGNYIYQIAKTLRTIDHGNRYEYYYGYYTKRLLTHDDFHLKPFSWLKNSIKKNSLAYSIARRMKDLMASTRKGFDIYFEPNFVPLDIMAKKTVITVPDFSFKLHPEWHPIERINYFEKYFWQKIGRADKVIFISDYIKKCAVNDYKFSDHNLTTIHLGFDKNIFRSYERNELGAVKAKYGLPDNFILFVGSVEPRKNLKSLIVGYMSLNEIIRKNFKIVLSGFKGWNNKEIMELLRQVNKDVIYLGYVPNSELGKLYNLAALFVYPSLYEGFGLPPLEAMACGCPVVVSNVASLPEVCGDAAYYVDPYNVESIAEGMYKVLTDNSLRETLIKKGLERVKLFSWEKSAKEHLKVFEDVLNI